MSKEFIHPTIPEAQRENMKLIEGLVDFRRELKKRQEEDVAYFEHNIERIEKEAERLGVDISELHAKKEEIRATFDAIHDLATKQFQERLRVDQSSGN